MLPTDLLMNRVNGETIVPKRVELDESMMAIASELINIFTLSKGSTRAELDRHLLELEGEETDYRFKRGLAHLLSSSFSEFETVSPLEPPMLRERVFAASALVVASSQSTISTLQSVADQLTQELEKEVLPEQVKQGLYADLPANQILTEFKVPTPDRKSTRLNSSHVE